MSMPLSWYPIHSIVTNKTKQNKMNRNEKYDIIMVSCNTENNDVNKRLQQIETFSELPIALAG